MCVWMWLYYAFTAATVIFLHCIANPLHADTALNLAAISDLENICQGLADVSEGAKRIGDVARGMREVLFKLVKERGRKRGVDDEGEGEGGRGKVRRMVEVEGGDVAGEGAGTHESMDTGNGVEELLEGAPMGFAWDEWDKWIIDADFNFEGVETEAE